MLCLPNGIEISRSLLSATVQPQREFGGTRRRRRVEVQGCSVVSIGCTWGISRVEGAELGKRSFVELFGVDRSPAGAQGQPNGTIATRGCSLLAGEGSKCQHAYDTPVSGIFESGDFPLVKL